MFEDMLERLRLADCEAHVAAFEPGTEQPPGAAVRDRDDAALDDQRRLVEGFD